MSEKEQLICVAAKLCVLGKKVEQKRNRLKCLVSEGISYESPTMLKALQEYQKAEAEWKQLETEYLQLRDVMQQE